MSKEELEAENKVLKQEIKRLKLELSDYKDSLSSQLRINIDNEKKVQIAKEITLFNMKQKLIHEINKTIKPKQR